MIAENFPQIEQLAPLQSLTVPGISSRIGILRAAYRRLIPPHYHDNPYIRETVVLNVILVAGGMLVTPGTPRSTFLEFYDDLRQTRPDLFRRILSPSGAAKAASTDQVTPIKEITQMCLSGCTLPGDEQLYGWFELENEANQRKLNLEVLFQGNGLFYNRGSVFFDGERLSAYPDAYLAEQLEEDPSPEARQRLAVDDHNLKRPLLFFVTGENGGMAPFYFRFRFDESYRQGMRRLLKIFLEQRARFALAASPPLVIPGPKNELIYLSLGEILSYFHASDIRHTLYCPYHGAVLLSAELAREHGLQPGRLAASLSGRVADRVRFSLAETLNFVSAAELRNILEEKGYSGRYTLEPSAAATTLAINPLEGVYSYLLPFLTRSGQFGLIQTSGTHGNITGNDGPTMRQLSAILRDLNRQPPFDRDPIIAAASGAQGNDVPNIVCRGIGGSPDLLHTLAPGTGLDENPAPRGTVTTPRVGIAFHM